MDRYFLIFATAVAMVGAIFDARSRRIPNQFTLAALAAGLVIRGAFEGLMGLESAIWGALLPSGILFLFFLAGGMGGGDVKLMAAVGAWVGIKYVTPVLLGAGLAGGILAIAYMVADGTVTRTIRNTVILVRHHLTLGLQPHSQIHVQNSSTTRVPFGIAIAMGTLFCAGSALLRR